MSKHVPADAKDLKLLIDQIRRAFWLLASISDEIVADLRLTSSTRAILEHLDEHGPATVPQIAAMKSRRRQSIQELVDQLAANRLVTFKNNPKHRRSQLVLLTETGKKTFAEVQARERRFLDEIARSLDGRSLSSAATTLEDLRTALAVKHQQGEYHDKQ
jgi:DNA-binding MarR family transcriptional regulator